MRPRAPDARKTRTAYRRGDVYEAVGDGDLSRECNRGEALTSVIAGPNDNLVVIVNRATYAVVALFGYGIGVYDVNAIESNDRPVDSGYLKVNEIVALTTGNNADELDPTGVHPLHPAISATSSAAYKSRV